MAKARKPKPYKTNRSNQVKRRKIIEQNHIIINRLKEELKLK